MSPYTLPALREDNRLTQFEQAATVTGVIRSRSHGHRSTNASAPTFLGESNIAAPDCDLDELIYNRLLAQCEDERRRAEERYRAEDAEEQRRAEIRRRYNQEWRRKQCVALIALLGYEPLYLDILYWKT